MRSQLVDVRALEVLAEASLALVATATLCLVPEVVAVLRYHAVGLALVYGTYCMCSTG